MPKYMVTISKTITLDFEDEQDPDDVEQAGWDALEKEMESISTYPEIFEIESKRIEDRKEDSLHKENGGEQGRK